METVTSLQLFHDIYSKTITANVTFSGLPMSKNLEQRTRKSLDIIDN